MYSNVKEKVIEGLSSAHLVALTIDCWTSRATQSFITVTAHYINDDEEIQNPVLKTRPIYEAHTIEQVILSKFPIDLWCKLLLHYVANKCLECSDIILHISLA